MRAEIPPGWNFFISFSNGNSGQQFVIPGIVKK
jgi:hypothetical protein